MIIFFNWWTSYLLFQWDYIAVHTNARHCDFKEVIAFPSSLCLDSLKSGDPAPYSNVLLICPSILHKWKILYLEYKIIIKNSAST